MEPIFLGAKGDGGVHAASFLDPSPLAWPWVRPVRLETLVARLVAGRPPTGCHATRHGRPMRRRRLILGGATGSTRRRKRLEGKECRRQELNLHDLAVTRT